MRQIRYREHLSSRLEWLPATHKSTAVAVYIFSGHSAQVAAEYCRQKKGSAAAEGDWVAIVEKWYLACSIDQIVALQHPEKKCDVRSATAARRWLAERHTAQWVRDQNFSLGVAPWSAAMADRFAEAAGDIVAGTVAKVGRTGRRFCQNLRKKWGIRLGVLKVRDEIPEDKIRGKARSGL